jgi:NAD(P)-dependent dehydrogenase (short-subunit alcohol dehydrogenase family)
MADGADVSDLYQVEDMVAAALDKWGRIDVLINNAGILRDKSFAKMEISDFRKVVDVHLMGSVHCSLAVWPAMRGQNYGRIVMTTSASGLYGNFGQSNYGAAKMAVAGLMNTLELEGGKYNVRINTVAPVALTRMTEEIIPAPAHALLQPEYVTPGVLFMASEDAPSGEIIAAGAGGFARAIVMETEGMYLGGDDLSPEKVAENWAEIGDLSTAREMKSAADQTQKFIRQAMAAGAADK